MEIPEELETLLDEQPIGHIASVRPNGGPHLVPVWIGYDGEYFRIAGRERKQRHTNVKNDPRVALTVLDLDNPYSRSFQIMGTTIELTPDGAVEFLNRKSKEYFGIDEHPITDSNRLLMKIEPAQIIDTSADFETDSVDETS